MRSRTEARGWKPISHLLMVGPVKLSCAAASSWVKPFFFLVFSNQEAKGPY